MIHVETILLKFNPILKPSCRSWFRDVFVACWLWRRIGFSKVAGSNLVPDSVFVYSKLVSADRDVIGNEAVCEISLALWENVLELETDTVI